MAANLRTKIPEADVLLINDRNTVATSKFQEEHGSKVAVEVLSEVKNLAERSVSHFGVKSPPCPLHYVMSSQFPNI